MRSPFCRGCGAKIEWHPHVDGRLVAIEPTPHPDGTLAFGAGMKLAHAPKGSRPRMYRYHVEGCSKPSKAVAARADDGGRRCYRCGKPGHFANECEEDDDV